eukprot:8657074-Karenia_brevis.AAC.1
MYEHGIVEMFDIRDAFSVNGEPVLAGLFGVERPQDPVCSKGPGLRIIMNCIPIISYFHDVASEVESLPRGGQWKNFVLLDGHMCWMCSEDQKSAFYLYRLPPNWK